jgi:predicted dinucleotide-binding enzyme
MDWTLAEAGAGDGTLSGKVLIDCNNPVEIEHFTLVTEPGSSLAEQLAADTGARVVKALHLVHARVWLENARFNGQRLIVPIAGDESAKPIVAGLVREAGGEPIDAGGLEQAHHLEAMGVVIIRQLVNGADPLSAFQLTVGAPAADSEDLSARVAQPGGDPVHG